MKIVIVGVGKIGLTIAESLSREGNDVTLIDTNAKIIEEAINSFDVIGFVGNGVNFATQREAGVNHADILIATTHSDEINMLCCLIGKKIGVKRAIARIRDPEYSRQFIYLLDEMGLDFAVNPEFECAGEISRLIRFPGAIGIDTFAKGRVDLVEMIIAQGSPLDGIAVKDISKTLNNHILVCAVQHGDEAYIPNGDSVLYAGDRIHFTSSRATLADFFRRVSGITQKLHNIMIIGGGRISYYLAKQLLDLGFAVRIVEKDEKRCNELCELLPKAEIILGDGTDTALLKEINFENSDACVAVTGIDEENIIISLYAQQVKMDKIVTKVNKSAITEMLSSIGLDSVISPKQITSDLILRYVRSMEESAGSSILKLYKLVDNRVEAIAFRITDQSHIINTPLKDLKLKKNILICCIIRDNTVIIPGGADVILPSDSVIVTTTSRIADIDDILR